MHLVKPLLVVALATSLVVAGPRGNNLRRRTGDDDKDSSSSALAKDQPSLSLVGTAPLGTGISSAPETTQEVVITDVVYTTLTTCPVTSLVTSGGTAFEEITTTISTVTRTSTSILCTKCVAPPSKSAASSSSSPVSSLPFFISYPLSQPSLTLPSISTFSAPGTGGLSAILLTNTVPVIPVGTAISSKPEVPSTAASTSRNLVFPSLVSLTVSAVSGTSSTLEFPGYGIVLSPTSTPGSPKEEIVSNSTSSIIPVYSAALLGNAYGGGFVSTPSVYVTKLPYPNGPSSGVPPGYGPESSITIIENNVTTVLKGTEASSTSATGQQSTTEIGIPAFTATVAPNVSVQSGSLGASTISAATSKNEGPTPVFISLSPFGGEVVQESGVAPIELLTTESSFPNSTLVGGATILSTVAVVSPVGAGSFTTIAGVALGPTPAGVVTPSELPTAESSFPTSTIVGGAAIFSTVATVSPIGAGSFTTIAGVALSPTPAGGVTLSEIGATIISSPAAEQSIGPVVTLAAGLSAETPAAGQPAVSTPTPIIVANGNTILAIPSPVIGANGLTSIPGIPTEASLVANSNTAFTVIPSPVVDTNGLTSIAGIPTEAGNVGNGNALFSVIPSPVIGANGLTSIAGIPTEASIVANSNTPLAVIPSPVVGANGLTSLAVFSTPIAPAAGLTTPAVLLTPIVGVNGLTSLAVVATPVVGANGLTSLAIGFETEITPVAGQSNSAPTPAAGHPNGVPTPVEGFIVVESPTSAPQISGAIPSINANLPSGSAESPVSGGSGPGNYSVHVLLNPTAVTQFEGSAVRLSLGFGIGSLGLMVFLVHL